MKPEQAAIALADSKVAGKTADELLASALLSGAESVHLEPHQELARVRYRIDGLLHHWGELSHTALQTLTAHFKHRAHLPPDESRWPQEGHFTLRIDDQPYEIRVATLPLAKGEKVMLHLHDPSTLPGSLAELGVWGETRTRLQKILARHQGLVVIAGSHHGGISTTLASMTHLLNHPSRSLASVGGHSLPRTAGVHTIRTSHTQGLGLTDGLRSAATSDANTIFVHDLFGQQPTNQALEIAAKGRLVVAGMRAPNLEQTLHRLSGASSERYLLASALQGILYQTLVRRLCEHCKIAAKPPAATIQRLSAHTNITLATLQKFTSEMQKHHPAMRIQLFAPNPKGCPHCHFQGFRGQVGLFELFAVSPTLQRRLTHHGDPLPMLHQAVREGMMPLLVDGFIKALCGLTTIEEVLKNYKRI